MTNAFTLSPECKFSLGNIYLTAAAEKRISREDAAEAVKRHSAGDWGDVVEDDRAENERALSDGGRLFSVYHGQNGTKFWVITEANRNSTTVLLPDDY